MLTLFVPLVLEIELVASCTLGSCSNTEPHPSSGPLQWCPLFETDRLKTSLGSPRTALKKSHGDNSLGLCLWRASSAFPVCCPQAEAASGFQSCRSCGWSGNKASSMPQLSFLVKILLFYLNQGSLGCCKPWLISRGQESCLWQFLPMCLLPL